MKFARNLIRSGKRPTESQLRQSLLRPNDLPSLASLVNQHIEGLENKKSLKGAFTPNKETHDVAASVFSSTSPSSSVSSVRAEEFLNQNTFDQPDLLSRGLGSVEVLISDIEDSSEYKQQYERGMQKTPNVMMCIGGPAAEDQVVMAGVIEQISARLDSIIYATRDYRESNVNHSARQSIARHGNALNADEALSGHRLVPILLMRKLIGVDLEDVLEPDYTKVDIEFTIDPRKLRIYFGNELNWLKQELKKLKGELNEHDINRLESSLSQEILIALEKQTGAQISGGIEGAQTDSSSIHVNFSRKEERHLEKESEDLERVGIISKKLPPEKQEFFFGENPHIYSAYEYSGDNHIVFNAHQINRELAESQGSIWLDNEEISRILVRKNEQGDAEIVGVVNKDGKYFYCNKLHFTGGYKVNYVFDPSSKERFQGSTLRNVVNRVEDSLGLAPPLSSSITTATGVSINAVFKKSDRLRRIIDKYGSTGEIAVTNSHWTMIASNDDHIVMRMTGGGNTGSEEYNPAYFLNVLANTRRIFGDDLIGILSTYGCPRAVNARNSTEFDVIAKGAVVSYGKGGTGNTKRHAEAAFGLIILGFRQEVVDHFNQFQTKDGKPLGDDISRCYEESSKARFFHDRIKDTNRRMGYDSSFSAKEMLLIGGFLVSLAVLGKAIADRKKPAGKSQGR
ncbi:MAG: hypothetical protein ACJAZX_001124 [Rickettsiales bacterium]|jgi:hypothetical protein